MAYTDQTQTYTQVLTADSTQQLVDLLFPWMDGGAEHRRKDLYTLKLKINTGGSALDILIQTDNQSVPIYVNTITTPSMQEVFVDIADILGVCKRWQLRLIGIVADFTLAELQFDYDFRPEPISFIKVNLADMGVISPNKKRIRTWPVTLESIDITEEVTITPYIDGVAQTALTLTGGPAYPQTVNYQFTADQWGIDFALAIHGCCAFELYRIHPPIGVQILPVAKRFDQVGPEQFFRWGKLQMLAIRLIAFGGTSIPGTIYFEDNSKHTFTITCVSGKEDVFEVQIPKTVAGKIARVELGPTAFDFHRYYITAKVAKSGKDTENEWVNMDDNFSQGAGQ